MDLSGGRLDVRRLDLVFAGGYVQKGRTPKRSTTKS